ncbi:MAG: hypothetical protein U1F07_01585 [Rubrivivax sp.]
MQSSNSNAAPDVIERVPDAPMDCAAALSDDALAASGLVKVAAYIRTKSSANATRVRKSRQKAADAGVRQLNVVVPLAAHAAMKAIAKDLQQGASLADVLTAAIAAAAPKPTAVPATATTQPEPLTHAKPAVAAPAPPPLPRPFELEAAGLSRLKGWRRLLARLLGLL